MATSKKNYKTNRLLKCFHSAKSKTEKLIDIRRCLEEKVDINTSDEKGNTLLHLAASRGEVVVVKFLLKRGADIHTRNSNRDTPLLKAICHKKLSVAVLLLRHGANVNSWNTRGQTALHIAVCNIDVDSVKFLLNNGAYIDAGDEMDRTPLFIAVIMDTIPIIELLLDNNADPDIKDEKGRSPLHAAVLMRNVLIMNFLQNKHAEIEARDENCMAPLHMAVSMDNILITKFLLNNNADINAKNENFRTPLHIAALRGHIFMVEFLVNEGAEVNTKDIDGRTPLHEIASYGIIDTVLLLLDKDADVNAQDEHGNAPLHLAVKNNDADVVKLLLKYGANIMLSNNEGDTPLSYGLIFYDDCYWKNIDALHPFYISQKNNNYPKKRNILHSKNLLKNKTKLKSNDTSGLCGQLYETKIVSLILIRALNHKKIEHLLLGINIAGIGDMDDICLRYRVKEQYKPVVLCVQAKETTKLNSLWSNSGDFSLPKYFKSYLAIRKRFQVSNEDPMFEGEFTDVACYFVLYTSGKENLTKKKTDRQEIEKIRIIHDLINTGHNTEPFQYCYDECDLNYLAKVTAGELEPSETESINSLTSLNYVELAKEFFSILWFYHGQAKEDEVECKIKYEISKHYNNENETIHYKFEILSDAIFRRSHEEIQKWWKQKGNAAYLCGSNDIFKHAKQTFLDEVWRTICCAIHSLKIDIDFQFWRYASINNEQRADSTVTSEDFNAILLRLSTIIDENNIIIININIKNQVVKLLYKERSTQGTTPSSSELTHNLSNFLNHNSQDNPHKYQQYMYSKRYGTSEAFGVLLRIKLLCLVFSRMLYHKQIEEYPSPLLGAKIRHVGVMNDICLRYHVKDQEKPEMLFMHLKHVSKTDDNKLTEAVLWNEHGDFSLQEHFASYMLIKERYRVGNNDSIFNGDYQDVNCCFGLYTSAQEDISKKKTGNRMSEVVCDLINTKQNTAPLQYNYDEADINRLISDTVKNDIVKLGTFFLECLRKPTKLNPNLLANRLVRKYHVVLRWEVLRPCEHQPDISNYRLWQFRSEFFSSSDEYLVILKEIFFKHFSSDEEKLKVLKMCLPLTFGNLDMTFCGNKTKAQKNMRKLAETLMHLLKLNEDAKIVDVTDDDIEIRKLINKGVFDIKGGIASAVGNLFVVTTIPNMLKFDLENKALPHNAALFLNELKDDKYKPLNEDLKDYRIKIHIKDFPKSSFYGDEYDKVQARDFLNKFWFFCNQAKEDEVENILKEEIKSKYSKTEPDQIQFNHSSEKILDFISSFSLDAVEKWWIEIKEPYLSRASKLFERAELACIGNLLQTVINYMYLVDVHTIAINIKPVDKLERVHPFFEKIVIKLFSLFVPDFNESIHFCSNQTVGNYKTSYIKLTIDPKLQWVSLVMTDKNYSTNECYRIVAKVDLSDDSRRRPRDMLKVNEMFSSHHMHYTWFRNCFDEDIESNWKRYMLERHEVVPQ